MQASDQDGRLNNVTKKRLRFVYNEEKAAQAAAFLLREAGGSMDYRELLNLLYLADRQSLIETGAPITGDEMVNMNCEELGCFATEPRQQPVDSGQAQ